MLLEQYLIESEKTDNPDQEPVDAQIVHACFGIITEVIELEQGIDKLHKFKKELSYIINSLYIKRTYKKEVSEMIKDLKNKIEDAKNNIIEEIGDVCWYIAILIRKFKLSIKMETIIDASSRVTFHCSDMTNLREDVMIIVNKFKRKEFYKKQVDVESIKESIEGLLFWLNLICRSFSIFNIKFAFKKNIEKLRVRYGDKFTCEKALNRDLKKEQEVLSK